MSPKPAAALLFLFICGMLLFNAPLLSAFTLPDNPPALLPLFLMFAWLALIAASALILRKTGADDDEQPEADP
ncbi:hypothetical protein CYPRO_2179 [Cyclonatronum proteinivorum]|uniref:DUF3311 domain-containing protein n=1 Tax=Cyclonatronum proteinivorum TaxID=1457365 RepID=A0A345ULS5_9BACT|nr:hypothetical protein [Cyclonatronum proteinivorum]AXJ01427.1 hypothetical protein CYPRO_2179 [Cyclonatronum proteinivorum]